MKNVLPALLIILLTSMVSFAQEAKYQLSTHILDITQGQPAAGVTILLSQQLPSGEWKEIDQKVTDENGRIKEFLKEDPGVSHRGIYKLTFLTAPYFERMKQRSFYPFIEVVFQIEDDNHYHVPITLSPFGYSTYRGN